MNRGYFSHVWQMGEHSTGHWCWQCVGELIAIFLLSMLGVGLPVLLILEELGII